MDKLTRVWNLDVAVCISHTANTFGKGMNVALLAGTVEYTDCISTEEIDPNECPVYDTKQSDGETQVMLQLL